MDIFKSMSLQSVFFLLLTLGLSSCNKSITESELIGVWKGTEFKFDRTEGPDLVALIGGGQELHEKSRLSLNENGIAKISYGQDDMSLNGTWELEDKILLVTMNGEDTYYEILSLNDQELVTRQEVEYETPVGKIAGTIISGYTR
jgi:hypothetical protein